MSWRSVVISNPAFLSFSKKSLQIIQKENSKEQVAKVPLEDISIIVIDHSQVSLTGQLLAACAEAQIAVITVNTNHMPNGILLPYFPHSRTLKVMKAQLSLSIPTKKRLWRAIVQQKIVNQAAVLSCLNCAKAADRLHILAKKVRSGDQGNFEAQAAQIYFPALFGLNFFRNQDRFYNAALNYGYAIIRAAISRTICSYGFLPAFGLFHHSELNSFNLADDLLEPYRPLVDVHICCTYQKEPINLEGNKSYILTVKDKVALVQLLHNDVTLNQHIGESGTCTLLSAIEATVISLSTIIQGKQYKREKVIENLVMPHLGYVP